METVMGIIGTVILIGVLVVAILISRSLNKIQEEEDNLFD